MQSIKQKEEGNISEYEEEGKVTGNLWISLGSYLYFTSAFSGESFMELIQSMAAEVREWGSRPAFWSIPGIVPVNRAL